MNLSIDPLFQLMHGSKPQMPQMNPFQMFRTICTAQNPQELFTGLTQGTPELQTVMKLVNENGGDAKSLFYKLCDERHVDPESILSQLR